MGSSCHVPLRANTTAVWDRARVQCAGVVFVAGQKLLIWRMALRSGVWQGRQAAWGFRVPQYVVEGKSQRALCLLEGTAALQFPEIALGQLVG